MRDEIVGKGNITAKIIADSVSKDGVRLTTMQLCYPRFIHGEFMTHRMFSRNAMSSRAVPVKKIIDQVRNNPAMPIHWGANQAGMQAEQEVEDTVRAKVYWEEAAATAAKYAEELSSYEVHKQVVNRILEPFQFMHTVVTATEWDNFFALRLHKDAQPEIYELSRCMLEAMNNNEPTELVEGQWHIPYVDMFDFVRRPINQKQYSYDVDTALKCSVARCARVSYLNHDQSQPSIEKDLKLYQMLYDSKHLSPFEHQASPMQSDSVDGVTHTDRLGNKWSGNFRNWIKYRKLIETGEQV